MESTTATLNTLPPTKEKKSCKKAITVNLKMTKYTIVKQLTLEVYQWKSVLSDEWDITWSDYYISEDFIRKLLPHQKINHFPGSYLLCKKNFLASHLLKIQQNLPEAYDFFPKTWILPFNYKNLQEYAEEHNYKKVFIAKPEASCQGRGIFLTKKVFKTLNDRENYVVQEYLKNPYLIDDYKFDLRLYVLIKNVEPLKIFLFQDGLARFATEKFQKPRSKNFMNLFMHLTNYSINKKNSNFQQNTIENGEEFGHKRSFKLEKEGKDVELLKKSIDDLIIKTVCSVQPYLAHIFKANRPKEQDAEMCFELLGFDILLDQNLKPWLLEVNHTPSFSTDSDLDHRIKFNLIKDTLKLVNVKRKNSKLKKMREIIEYEDKNLGNFKRIYPNNDIATYDNYMNSAKEIWDLWSQGKRNRGKVHITSLKNDAPEQKPKRNSVRPISAIPLIQKARTNYLKTNNLQSGPIVQTTINQNQNQKGSHIPHTFFPQKPKQFIRPKSAFNAPYKCEECKREEMDESHKDLRIVKDFLRPKNGGFMQEFNFNELLKNSNPNDKKNSFAARTGGNYNNYINYTNGLNSLGSMNEFEDKKLQMVVNQKGKQFPPEFLFGTLSTNNFSQKSNLTFVHKQITNKTLKNMK